MKSKKIDLEKWPRKDLFEHFIKDVRCVITITAEIEITKLINFCNENGLKFYPAMLYHVVKAVSGREEFKIGYSSKKELVVWEKVFPSHVIFNESSEDFTRIITQYDNCFEKFYTNVIEDIRENKDKRAFEVSYSYKNTFDVSCLPWLKYKSCDLHIYDDGTYLAPVITWGKYEKHKNKYALPLTMQIHHAVADGFHIAQFFADVEKSIQVL